MSGLRDLAKGGWHPKGKDGGRESWRGDFKGVNQVAGWMGKGRDPTKELAKDGTSASGHHSAPLSTLKDPSTFGPPPKHIAAHGPQAAAATGAAGAGPSMPAARVSPATTPTTAAAPVPPKRGGTTAAAPPTTTTHAGSAAPRLPPRLPPRQNSTPVDETATAPPPYSSGAESATPAAEKSPSYLNTAAAGRLGRAGVSVPGLGIGKTSSPPPTTTGTTGPPPPTGSQLSELSSRFSRFGTSSSSTPASATPDQPAAGTTWAQKQSALQTAQSFHKDPSSVSLSDARSAASTANNFRARHGEQVAAGWKKAGAASEKYGIADRVGRMSGVAGGGEQGAAAHGMGIAEGAHPDGTVPAASSAVGKKAPPPPPPKKKPGLAAHAQGEDAGGGPPPIPLSSKPR